MFECKNFNDYHAVKYTFIENWEDYLACIKAFPNALYRGQSNAEWKLTSSLERAFPSGCGTDICAHEKRMLAECKRKYGVYNTAYIQRPDGPYSWLSLMQHYGATTRLLDVTRSPYIALFFALIDMKKDDNGCLWILSTDWGINDLFFAKLLAEEDRNKIMRDSFLNQYNISEIIFLIADRILEIKGKSSFRTMPSDPLIEKIDRVLLQIYRTGAVLEVPIGCESARSIAQQAAFLMPVNLEKTFEENLIGILKGSLPCPVLELDQVPYRNCKDPKGRDFILDLGLRINKLIIPYELRKKFLNNLNQMNINYGTLYPDVEGLMKKISFSARGA